MSKFFVKHKTIAVDHTNNFRLRCAHFLAVNILMYSVQTKRFLFWWKYKCNIHIANDCKHIKDEDMAALIKFIAFVDKVDAAKNELKKWKDSKEVVEI